MKIIVDAFGGDNSPLAVLQGAAQAVEEYGVEIVLCGDEEKIKQVCAQNNISLQNMEIANANGFIDVHEEPTEILKSRSDCSMAVGLKLLAEGKGDAFVTAGSTGAVVVGASMYVKRIKGVKRAALAPIMPCKGGNFMLMDSGANLECRPEMLLQFGLMASIFMEKVMNVKSPRVGLANVGAEDTKGTQTLIDAYHLLQKAPVNFIGNVEGRDVPLGMCDVCVAEGMVGNMILKVTEGVAMFFMSELKSVFTTNAKTKLSYLLLKSNMKGLKKKMDYTEVGGAPLMGVQKPVIKAHGSSDAKAIKNAIRQAKTFAERHVIASIEQALSEMKEQTQPQNA